MEKVKDKKYNGAVFTNSAKQEYDKKCIQIVSNFTGELKQRQSKDEITLVDVNEAYHRFNKKTYRGSWYIFFWVLGRLSGVVIGALLPEIFEAFKNNVGVNRYICVFIIVFLIIFLICAFKEYKNEI